MRYLPDLGITISVLTNQSAIDPTRVATTLLKVLLPKPTPSPSPAASGAPSPALAPSPS